MISPRVAACGSCICCTNSAAHTTTTRRPLAPQASSPPSASHPMPRSACPAEIDVTSRRPHSRPSNPHCPHHLRPRGPPHVRGSRRQPLPVLIVASPRPSRRTRASRPLHTLAPQRAGNYRTAGIARSGHSAGARSPRCLVLPRTNLTGLLQHPDTLLTRSSHLAAILPPENRLVLPLVASAASGLTGLSGCKPKALPSGCFSLALTATTNT